MFIQPVGPMMITKDKIWFFSANAAYGELLWPAFAAMRLLSCIDNENLKACNLVHMDILMPQI